ncbi:MAG: hypothetical protein OIN66_09130 [Candidatus Methanoperedens sp.]|nr:hypothetical protein [Candidatus Methanoperedens sp.]
MKKVWAVLLLISAVIGTAVPGMADPNAKVDKKLDINVEGTNWASNSVSQSQDIRGDQTNNAVVAVLGGNARSDSNADADGSAGNNGEAEVGDENDDGSAALAGNLLSGNAVALSGAEAIAGDATNNGNVIQVNANVQLATADINNIQVLKQKIRVHENIEPEVTVDDSIFDNTVGDENNLEVEEE